VLLVSCIRHSYFTRPSSQASNPLTFRRAIFVSLILSVCLVGILPLAYADNNTRESGDHGESQTHVRMLTWAENFSSYLSLVCCGGKIFTQNAVFAYSILQTRNGGYFVAGVLEATSNGGTNDGISLWLMMLNPAGRLLWQKTYSDGNPFNYRPSAVSTRDGGFVIIARSESSNGSMASALIFKIDQNGTILWQKRYSATGFLLTPYSVNEATDGGFVVLGLAQTKIPWLMKVDNFGNLVWVKTYNVFNINQFGAISIATSGNGYVLAIPGILSIGQQQQFTLLKVSSAGDVSWERSYIGEMLSVASTSDGGFAVSGSAPGQGVNGMVLKLNSMGIPQSEITLDEDRIWSVQQTRDDGYVIGGRATSPVLDRPTSWIAKLGIDGEIIWQRDFNTPSSTPLGGFSYSVSQMSDGGYAVVSYDFYSGNPTILKLDQQGRCCANIDRPANVTATKIHDIAFETINGSIGVSLPATVEATSTLVANADVVSAVICTSIR